MSGYHRSRESEQQARADIDECASAISSAYRCRQHASTDGTPAHNKRIATSEQGWETKVWETHRLKHLLWQHGRNPVTSRRAFNLRLPLKQYRVYHASKASTLWRGVDELLNPLLQEMLPDGLALNIIGSLGGRRRLMPNMCIRPGRLFPSHAIPCSLRG